MEKVFSVTKFGWRLALVSEVTYILFILYAGFLDGEKEKLYRDLIEISTPGFQWGSVGGFLWGAFLMFVCSWVCAWVTVWILNGSLQRKL